MKIFIHRSALFHENNLVKGLARNLYFINKVLNYEVVLMSEPGEVLKALFQSEDINYQRIGREIHQNKTDVLVATDELVDFPGKTLHYSPESGWDAIYLTLRKDLRRSAVSRITKETDILIRLSLDGTGQTKINTGLGFFNHMLEQIGKHSGCDLEISVKGDLGVDEHHTIEDTAIALGEAFKQAVGDKKGLSRYGFFLPMDDSICWAALDFGGRPWLNWVAEFKREYVGDMPTEMFMHFFKSFADAAALNLYIKAEGNNEHHMIEAIFKAFARAIGMAVRQEPYSLEIPTTKGLL